MNQVSMSERSKKNRDLELKEDFGIFNGLTVTNVDGKLMLGNDDDLPFSVEHVMEEHEFVRVWLRQFALGNSIGINYFNLRAWNEISSVGQKSVMVVDANLKPILVIPPLLSTNLTEAHRRMLQQANAVMHGIGNTPSNKGVLGANTGAAAAVVEGLDNVKRLTYTDLIPEDYYTRHKIIPEVEQQVHYIKDVINANNDISKSLNETKDILTKLSLGKDITSKEVAFLEEITKGEFVISKAKDDKSVSAQVKEEDNDPLSC